MCALFNIYYFFIANITRRKHRYIEETLEQDRARFKLVPTVNPFLADFNSEAPVSADGHNNGALRVVNAIGSTHAILGTL
jgi:hypothetical protein